MKKFKSLLVAIAILIPCLLAAQNPYMVKDIQIGLGSSSPRSICEYNGYYFFAAEDGTNGIEFWKSDGTTSGTVMLKDMYTSGSSDPSGNNCNSLIYVTSKNDGGVWKSNGTSNGTTLVKALGGNLYSFNNSGNLVFFVRQVRTSKSNESELWKTDGTSRGTVVVKSINNKGSDEVETPRDCNGIVFFWANNGVNGREIWKSNGTSAGTVMVKDILPGSSGSWPRNMPEPWLGYSLLVSGIYKIGADGYFYFTANNGTNGSELWKSDGTSNGTYMLDEINPGSGDSYPHWLTRMGDYIYFSASDNGSNYELFKVSLLNGGITKVKEICSGSDGSYPMWLTPVGNTLYFSANNGTNGRELWKSDGTEDGTVMVRDICSGGKSSNPGDSISSNFNRSTLKFTSYDGVIYFEADDGVNGNKLWRSDGTEEGTFYIDDINNPATNIQYPIAAGGKIFYSAYNSTNGQELWVYDPLMARKGFYESEDAIVSDDYKLRVYPNPAIEEVNITGSFKGKTNVEVRLLDLLGKELAKIERNAVTGISENINISGISSGIYFMEFNMGSKKLVSKFVKK